VLVGGVDAEVEAVVADVVAVMEVDEEVVAVDTKMEEDNNGDLEEVAVVPGHKEVVVAVDHGVELLLQVVGAELPATTLDTKLEVQLTGARLPVDMVVLLIQVTAREDMVVDLCAQLGLVQLVDTEQLHTVVVPLVVVSKAEGVAVVVVVTGEECNSTTESANIRISLTTNASSSFLNKTFVLLKKMFSITF